MRTALEERFKKAEEADLTWRPQTTVPVDEDKAETLFKLIEVLEDNDDVQSVSANFEIDDSILERMSA